MAACSAQAAACAALDTAERLHQAKHEQQAGCSGPGAPRGSRLSHFRRPCQLVAAVLGHACMLGLDAQGAMEIVFLASALALLDDYTPDYFSVSHFISFYDNIQA